MGKGEIARDEQILLFPQYFQLNQITVYPFVHIFDIISLFAVELEEPRIGILGKELILFQASFFCLEFKAIVSSSHFIPCTSLFQKMSQEGEKPRYTPSNEESACLYICLCVYPFLYKIWVTLFFTAIVLEFSR